LPEGVLVLLISRHKPAPPWISLWVKEQLALLEWPDLQLNQAEIEAFIELKTRSKATSRLLQEVQGYTQGWVEGLVLFLHGARPCPRLSSLAFEQCFHYFAEEVWRYLTSAQRHILIESALLPAMSAAGLAGVTGNPRAIAVIEELWRNDYFTCRLDNEEYGNRGLTPVVEIGV
jgi:ATP/maltotriose-dependent transcriptional regulator MalT